ncbi:MULTISPECIES: Crp/Fnr family transcriptional regulator [Parabacteroides]|uniref:cAMP-binding domain of CRP or a regulatory subunit of cAMP-dependent protein kinases n=1 Tax=Parabacteroides chinchillae TaxID=871327 RepID=A0A8G2BXJ8_9BACT|nr:MULTISPECIES: Crp/Fnr family transcriptional regulator [Parabacteroides]SEG05656.1 cAMP-binding domain of CRP or a regulatory subunit of cAMP-dependent protein kinases [Parabacteroides chinchillae]
METDASFARLLADIPEALAGDKAFVKELEDRAKVLNVKKGDYLLRTGELCQDAYFINKGLFINLYISEKGEEAVTGFAADSEFPFLSAIGYFTQAPSDFEIKAIEDGELLCFSRVQIEEMSLRYPLFASYYQNVMLTIIAKLYSMFAVRQSCTAEEFIKYLYNHYKWIINRVPDKYIAQYMGVSNTWYCKLKKRIFC